MSALGTVTVLPSLRVYSTSIWATRVSPNCQVFSTWWLSPSMVAKNPATASRTASRPMTGLPLPNRNTASGVKLATNRSGSKESMSAKIGRGSRVMSGLLVGDEVVDQAGLHVSGGAVPVHQLGVAREQGGDGLGEVDPGEERLPGREAGLPVDLGAVAFRVEEVDAEGVAMADDDVEAHVVGDELLVELDQLGQRVDAERDLLDQQRALAGVGHGTAADQLELVVFEVGPGAEEPDTQVHVLVGDRETHHVPVELGAQLHVPAEQSEVSQLG